MTEKTRPAKVDRKVYNEFRKYCIDEDLEVGKALEKAIKEFTGEGEKDDE